MTKQLFIYENAVALNRNTHKDFALGQKGDLSFATELSTIPLAVIEFHQVAKYFPILFAKGKDGNFFPVALTGVSKKNLFVNKEGESDMGYTPLFVRQYPFVFAKDEDPSKLSLFIDESFSGWNQEGKGERLFDSEGEATEFLNAKIRFMQQTQAEFLKTQVFGKQLVDKNLLKAISVHIPNNIGEKEALSGFYVLDKEALKKLSNEDWALLGKNDTLELLYLHSFSINKISLLAEKYKEMAY